MIQRYKHFPKDEIIKQWHYDKKRDYGLEEDDEDDELEGSESVHGLELSRMNSNPMLWYTNVTSWNGAGPIKKRGPASPPPVRKYPGKKR